jgi:peptidoglycan/xylan/chitin deacetylase (PgdA/CDA1 family)
MSVRGLRRLKHAAQSLFARRAPRGLVLMYHRVAEPPSDPWALCVSARRFSEQMEVLRREFCPLPLRELTKGLDGNDLPARAVAVTFDDGYADNLHAATPILEKQAVAATLFLAAGYVGSAGEFWWDELDRLLLQPGTLPETLRLQIGGRQYEWQLGGDAAYTPDQARRDRDWIAWGQPDPTVRHTLYRAIWELLQPLEHGERSGVVDELRCWSALGSEGRASHRILSEAEVLELARHCLVEIGAHTLSHPLLRALPRSAQLDEIRGSKEALEALLGGTVDSFAYPFGREIDYTAETVELVREAGFAHACSNFAGLAVPSTDRFQIPRLHVQDWDGDTFAQQLSAQFHG